MKDQTQSQSTPPPFRTLFSAQLSRVVARRKGLLVVIGLLLAQCIAMASFGIVFGITVTTNENQAPTYGWTSLSTLELDVPLDEGTAALAFVAFASLIQGLFWSISVWRGESPSYRGYHWIMPVDHRTHDLARVLAGAFWLMAFVCFLVVATLIAAVSADTGDQLATLSWSIWLTVFTAPLICYLLATPAALRSDSPAAWIFGTLGLLGAGWSLSTASGLHFVARAIEFLGFSQLGLLTTLARPLWAHLVGQPAYSHSTVVGSLALWTMIGLSGTLLASKPRLL